LKLRFRYCVLSYVFVLLLGFAFTRVGLSTWDSPAHLQYMRWLIGKWTGREVPVPFETVKWYGPLWEYVLALFTGALWFLRDPLWIRHAVTFTLLPVTLVGVSLALRASGESRGTALLAVALLSSNIRFVGHSLLNVKDFPFACGYLLCTLLLWSLLNGKLATPSGLLQRPGWLFVATLVAVVPYLLRAPVIPHWLLLVGLCVWAALLESRDVPWKRKWWVALVPLTTGPLVVWVLWPTLWETGIRGLPESFGLFSRFAWLGHVRLFGQSYLSTELPWWYGLAWIPVSWEPVGLAVLAVGIVGFVVVVTQAALRSGSWSASFLLQSLPVWVALFALAPGVAVLVLRPVLYDEERHLMFAMPLLAVSAALGLRGVGEKVKVGLSCLVLVSVASALASWGKYAYVYKDPLLPHAANEDFMGDYWGVSSGSMAQALYDHVPSGSYVVVIAPPEPLLEELQRRETSLFLAAPMPKSFQLEDRGPPSGPFYVVATNRNGVDRRILEDIAAGRARQIWAERMPPGDSVAAVLAYYTEPCPHCRFKVRLM
jgi:hypothetical protein